MNKIKMTESEWLRKGIVRIARVQLGFVLAFAITNIVSDAWGLITPETVMQRWTITVVLLAVTTIVWYTARYKLPTSWHYKGLVYTLVLTDIFVAAVSVYGGRGMASRAVMLFAIPIVVSAVLLTRTALFATALLCTAAYVFAAMKYFVEHPAEGYKVELYTEVGFYAAVFFVLAAVLAAIVQPKP